MNNTQLIPYHFGFWIIFWAIQSLLWSNGQYLHFYLAKNVAIVSLQAGLVYGNIYLLFPILFKRRKYFWYVFFGVMLVYLVFISSFTWIETTLLLFSRFVEGLPLLDFPNFTFKYTFWHFLSGSAPYSLALVCSLVWKIYRENERHQSLAQELKIQQAQTEIQFLRSQINPHFLFNSLNNIHLLILKDQKVAAKYTIVLSDLLRYMLYEVKNDQTTLKKEIKCIEQYLQLVEFKMEDPNRKSIQVNIENEQLSIVPLLLVAFIENGIKHSGIEYSDQAFLNITLEESNQRLKIQMENSVAQTSKASFTSGIGMDNLKRRLTLHYPKQHQFTFNIMNQKAITELVLNLPS